MDRRGDAVAQQGKGAKRSLQARSKRRACASGEACRSL
jgi:hypothetical protein